MTELTFTRIDLFKNETLGIGSYGAVCKAKCDDLLCAAKILHPTLFDPNSELEIARHREHRLPMRRFEQECEFMSAIRHPNIVQYLGTHRDPETDLPVLLMELMDDSLTHFYIQVNICHDVAAALSFLHSNDILHRDMSSNNVLLISNSRAKVTDFGMAKFDDMNRQATHASFTMCPGTDVYMPPEATGDRPRYTEKIDCFSFGVLGVQILTRIFPKPGDRMREEMINGRQMFARISEVERRQNHIRQVDPNHSLLPIALDCLKDEDVERPSAQELCHRVAALKQTRQYRDSERSVTQERGTAEERELQHQLQINNRGIEQLEHQLETSQQLNADQQQQIHDFEQQINGYQQQVRNLEEQILDNQQQHTHQIEDLQQQHSADLQHLAQNLGEKDAQIETSEELLATFQTRVCELERLQRHAECRACIKLSCRTGNKAPSRMARDCDAVVSGCVVYFRNVFKIYAYNSTNTTWSRLPDCPVEHCSLAVVNNNLTTIGGDDSGKVTNQLFSLTGEGSRLKWTEVLPRMPTYRSFTIAVRSGENLIVAGGELGDRCLTTVEVLSTATIPRWLTAVDLPSPLSHSSVTICGDHIFMLGGWDTGLLTKLVWTCSLSVLLQTCHSNPYGLKKIGSYMEQNC